MNDMKNFIKDMDEDKVRRVFHIKKEVDAGNLTMDEGKARMKEEIGFITPPELAYLEQVLKEFEEDECRKEDIQQMLELYEDILVHGEISLPKDHPISCYRRENEALKQILLEIEDLLQYPVIKNQWYEIYDKLMEYPLHLKRKQNQLYSVLEKKGFDRPTTTMWTLDDFVWGEIKEARELLESQEEAFLERQPVIVADVRDLIEKEETVLYPTSLEMIDEGEFEEMKSGDREIGFAWIDADHQGAPSKGDSPGGDFQRDLLSLMAKYGLGTGPGEELDVAMGKLTLEEINLIYKHMPVDLAYVDERDLVRFYTDTSHRIFPRSKNVIGRNVKNCHPRKSVHVVEEILEKFRSGEEDEAEFWINKPDLFIYIHYTAVRDDEGRFRGVLEMMQDCTRIRSLTGSRTLLTWDGEEEGNLQETSSEEAPLEEVSEITGDSKLGPLLEKYPDLKEELPTLNPAFKMLKTPLARVMVPKATVATMAERSAMDLEELLSFLREFVKARRRV